MRYIRQEIFKEIGKEGQNKLNNSNVAIVGIGALGTVSADLLARAGVNLVLIDRDIVELSNLQRQSLFDEDDIGKSKSMQAKHHLEKINSEIKIKVIADDLNPDNIDMLKSVDLILDCTDNLETRFLLNDFCVKNKIKFIYSSAIGNKGYVYNIIPNNPCLKCFLKEAVSLDTCDTTGVLNTITHAIASLQTNEAIKILLDKNYEKNLLFFDIWENELNKIKVNKNNKCVCCVENKFEYLKGKSSKTIKLCGNGMFQVRNGSLDSKQFNELKARLEKLGKIIDLGYAINFDRKITIFDNGRALIKADDEAQAKSLYSKFVGN